VLEFYRRVPIRTSSFAKIGGRNVMIDEQVFVQSGGGSAGVKNADKLVLEIIKKLEGKTGASMGAVSSMPSYSSLTSISYLPKISQSVAYPVPYPRVSSLKSLLRSSNVMGYSKPSASSSKISSSITGSSAKSVSSTIASISSLTSKILKSSSVSSVSPPSSVSTISPISQSNIYGWYFPSKQSQQKSKRQSKLVQDLLYLPDFTSRALGLKPQTISEKDAVKKLKKLMTGFEVRRPVKIKY